jgi:flagellar basal-body rod protein FlgG
METQQTKIDIIANNLANVNTAGFKRARGDFEDLLYQTIRTPGSAAAQGLEVPTGIQIGQGARTVATQRMFEEGDLKQTGNPLDLAIEGVGFFQILQPGGETTYTRAGAFKTDSQGRLVTAAGYLVDPAITFPPDALNITVGRDGTVTVVQPNQTTPIEVGRVQLAQFANPSGLEALGGNLYRETQSSGRPIIGTPGIPMTAPSSDC